MEDHYIFWIKALYMGLYLHWIASSLLTYDAFILPHQNKYYKSTKTERWKCGLIEQKTISCSKEQSVRWQPQESSEMLQTVREANSTKTFWDNASKKLFKIQENLMMAHLTNHSNHSNQKQWLGCKQGTHGKTLFLRLKMSCVSDYATNHSFIHSFIQVQVSLPLILHFCTTRFKRTYVQWNSLISAASFVRGYQLTCSYSLGTTLEITGLSKIEIMVLVWLPVPYPPNDPSVACQMRQPSVKLH